MDIASIYENQKEINDNVSTEVLDLTQEVAQKA